MSRAVKGIFKQDQTTGMYIPVTLSDASGLALRVFDGSDSTPPPPPPTSDWRTIPRFQIPAGQFVFTADAGTGNLPEIEAQFGHRMIVQNVYDNRVDLAGITGTVQDWMDQGYVVRYVFPMPNALGPDKPNAEGGGYGTGGRNIGNIDGTGKTMWGLVSEGYWDNDRVAPNGRTVKGFRSRFTALKNLNAGQNPNNWIVFTFCHEADLLHGSGAPSGGGFNAVRAGTAAEYRSAFRYLRALADSLGCTNIVWGWNMAFDPQAGAGLYKWGDTLTDEGSDGMYPGHNVVDLPGFDPYLRPALAGYKWMTFAATISKINRMTWIKTHFTPGGAPTYAEATAGQGVMKTFWLYETACDERLPTYTGAPGEDAETWLNGMSSETGPAGTLYPYVRLGNYWSFATSKGDWALRPEAEQKWRGLANIGDETNSGNTHMVYHALVDGEIEDHSTEPPHPPVSGMMAVAATSSAVGIIESTGTWLKEISGGVASMKNGSDADPVHIMLSDSGNPNHVYWTTPSGGIKLDLELVGTTNRDWEDIANFYDPVANKHLILVINSGNVGGTDPRTMYMFEEPVVTTSQSKVTTTLAASSIKTYHFNKPCDNSEAFFIEPVTGNLYYFQKLIPGNNVHIYSIPAIHTFADGATVSFDTVPDVCHPNKYGGTGPTAGAMTNDGLFWGLRNYKGFVGWKRGTGETVESMVAARPYGDFDVEFDFTGNYETVWWNRAYTKLYHAPERGTGQLRYTACTIVV